MGASVVRPLCFLVRGINHLPALRTRQGHHTYIDSGWTRTPQAWGKFNFFEAIMSNMSQPEKISGMYQQNSNPRRSAGGGFIDR